MPLTSSTGRLYPSEAYVTAAGERRKAMADQLATVSKLRLRRQLGRIDAAELAAVSRAIRTQLSL